MSDAELRTDEGEIDPNRIAADIEQHGTAWAKLDHAAKVLEKTRDSVLCRLILAVRQQQPNVSLREADMIARASDDYETHIYAMTDAKLKANLARVRFEAAQARFEAMRTAEASRRAEMTAFGRR